MSTHKSNVNAPPSPTQSSSSLGTWNLPYATALVPQGTLYERLGGETKIKALTEAFFQEIGKVEGLAHFFVNVPVAAIQLHQGQFFKVLFGAAEEKPSADELLDYMILTHVRLFRDLGLDASHFDLVAVCFIDAMNQLAVPPDLQDECLAIVGPLRVAFDYGAAVARRERMMSADAFKKAPLATIKTMRGDVEAKLPAGLTPPPEWLVQFVGGRDRLRAWTAALTHRMVVQDEILSQTFFNLAYLDMEPYCHSLLHLAFARQIGDDIDIPLSVFRTVRFPCGITKPGMQLNKDTFARITSHFFEIGIELGKKDQCWLIPQELVEITDALRERQSMFVGRATETNWSAVERHHRLRHNPTQAPQLTLEQQLEAKEKIYEELMKGDAKEKKNKDKRKSKSKATAKEEAPEQAHPRASGFKNSWFFRLLAQKKARKDKNRRLDSLKREIIQI